MLIGPFGDLDIQSVKDLLDAKKIPFEVVMSEEDLKTLQGNRTFSRFYQPGPSMVLHFEITDEDFLKIASQMEKYGIVLADSDGSWELGGDDDEGPTLGHAVRYSVQRNQRASFLERRRQF